MLWKPTISASDPPGIVQLKRLLHEIVDAIRGNVPRGDGCTTSDANGVITALPQFPDWALPYIAESGAGYTTGLYHAKIWIRQAVLDDMLAATDPQETDAWARFSGAVPGTLTGLAPLRATRHMEDVSAAQDGSDIAPVWVIDPIVPYSTGDYLLVVQDGVLTKLAAPASGSYFLRSTDGTWELIESGLCPTTTTTTTTP